MFTQESITTIKSNLMDVKCQLHIIVPVDKYIFETTVPTMEVRNEIFMNVVIKFLAMSQPLLTDITHLMWHWLVITHKFYAT